MAQTYQGRDVALSFVGGFVAALLLLCTVGFIALRNSDAYGVGHWKLNARMPLASTWMNLGYWTDSKGEPIQVFEQACANLLREILRTAGLLESGSDAGSRGSKSLAILDLGFGCGDQTFELIRLTQPASGWDQFRYVGLTLNQAQVQTASRIVAHEVSKSSSLTSECFKLFRADAAQPKSWNPQARAAVESLANPSFGERWLLALDCLYHFRPSRKPIFKYAATELGAGAMAFDLVLNEKASRRDVWLARLICIVMQCPVKAFLTEAEYRAELQDCGYGPDQITIQDISDHVFAPVSAFLENQERALSQYGVSMGGYKLAGRIFSWFGRSQVVKAVIMVARPPGPVAETETAAST